MDARPRALKEQRLTKINGLLNTPTRRPPHCHWPKSEGWQGKSERSVQNNVWWSPRSAMSVEISNFLCLRKAEWYQTGKVSLGHGACQGKGAPEQGINYMAHTKKTNANA